MRSARFIATLPTASHRAEDQELLVTVWVDDDDSITVEVAPRSDDTRWDAPLPIRTTP